MVDVKKTKTTTFKSDDVTVNINQGDVKFVFVTQGDNSIKFTDKPRFKQFCEDCLTVMQGNDD